MLYFTQNGRRKSFILKDSKAYQVRKILAAGSFGSTRVFAAKDDVGTSYVVKRPHNENISSLAIHREYATKELAFFKAVYPNLEVEYFVIRDGYRLVMPYLGKTLSETLDTEQDYNQGLRLLIAVGKELLRIHKLGIVHRDLHSHNILVDKKGNVRLIDGAMHCNIGVKPPYFAEHAHHIHPLFQGKKNHVSVLEDTFSYWFLCQKKMRLFSARKGRSLSKQLEALFNRNVVNRCPSIDDVIDELSIDLKISERLTELQYDNETIAEQLSVPEFRTLIQLKVFHDDAAKIRAYIDKRKIASYLEFLFPNRTEKERYFFRNVLLRSNRVIRRLQKFKSHQKSVRLVRDHIKKCESRYDDLCILVNNQYYRLRAKLADNIDLIDKVLSKTHSQASLIQLIHENILSWPRFKLILEAYEIDAWCKERKIDSELVTLEIVALYIKFPSNSKEFKTGVKTVLLTIDAKHKSPGRVTLRKELDALTAQFVQAALKQASLRMPQAMIDYLRKYCLDDLLKHAAKEKLILNNGRVNFKLLLQLFFKVSKAKLAKLGFSEATYLLAEKKLNDYFSQETFIQDDNEAQLPEIVKSFARLCIYFDNGRISHAHYAKIIVCLNNLTNARPVKSRPLKLKP